MPKIEVTHFTGQNWLITPAALAVVSRWRPSPFTSGFDAFSPILVFTKVILT
jgi:hypothetical protein